MGARLGTGVYGLHGLRLRSELALAGFGLSGAAHDLAVLRGPPGPVSHAAPAGALLLRGVVGEILPMYVASERDMVLTLRVPGRCEFAIDRERRTVRCRTDPDTDERLTGVLVAGLVVALILNLDGHAVLHASAVELGGAALAFAGPSGAGKSTLGALMCAAGARLVSDDLLRVEPVAGRGLLCAPGGPQLRLRPRAAWATKGIGGPPFDVTVDGRLALTPPATRDARLPLRTIVLPRVTPAVDRVVLRTLTGGEAVRALAGTHRLAGWTRPELLRRQFEQTARIAECADVVEATLPRSSRARAQIVPALLELCASESPAPAGMLA